MVRETCEIQRFKKLLEGAGEDFPLERICFQKAVRAVRRFWPELLLSSSVVVTLVDRVSVQLILQSEEVRLKSRVHKLYPFLQWNYGINYYYVLYLLSHLFSSMTIYDFDRYFPSCFFFIY